MALRNIIILILCYLCIFIEATNSKNSPSESLDKPYFDDVNPRNVTTNIDGIALLKCRVKNKGNRTISWIRVKDLSIIAANNLVYSGDQRFTVVHETTIDEWNLKIEYVQQRDAGFYECQVNTEPKINLMVYLHVTAAQAKISGSQEVHVKVFSTISLSCTVNVLTSSIHWYHGSKIVNFNSTRGGISLETEKTDFSTTSRLLITRATLADSGNYSCVPKDQDAVPASVMVHVINGEQPAAMQTSHAQKLKVTNVFLLLAILTAMQFVVDTISLRSTTTYKFDAKTASQLTKTFEYVINQNKFKLSNYKMKMTNQMFLENCLNDKKILMDR